MEQFGFQTFTNGHYRQFAAEIVSLADQTHQGILLARAPGGKSSESQNHHSRFTSGWNAGARGWSPERSDACINGLPLPLSEDQKKKLETLLNVREGTIRTSLTL
jgi:hypothetical protein